MCYYWFITCIPGMSTMCMLIVGYYTYIYGCMFTWIPAASKLSITDSDIGIEMEVG